MVIVSLDFKRIFNHTYLHKRNIYDVKFFLVVFIKLKKFWVFFWHRHLLYVCCTYVVLRQKGKFLSQFNIIVVVEECAIKWFKRNFSRRRVIWWGSQKKINQRYFIFMSSLLPWSFINILFLIKTITFFNFKSFTSRKIHLFFPRIIILIFLTTWYPFCGTA